MIDFRIKVLSRRLTGDSSSSNSQDMLIHSDKSANMSSSLFIVLRLQRALYAVSAESQIEKVIHTLKTLQSPLLTRVQPFNTSTNALRKLSQKADHST